MAFVFEFLFHRNLPTCGVLATCRWCWQRWSQQRSFTPSRSWRKTWWSRTTMLNAQWWRRGSWPRETSLPSSHSSTPASRLWCVCGYSQCLLPLRRIKVSYTSFEGSHFPTTSFLPQAPPQTLAFSTAVCVFVWLPALCRENWHWAETPLECKVSSMTSILCVDRVTQGVFNKTCNYWSKHCWFMIQVYEVTDASLRKKWLCQVFYIIIL